MSSIAKSASIHKFAVVEDGAIIGENVEFIQLITDKTRGRQLPIPSTDVFSSADFMQ